MTRIRAIIIDDEMLARVNIIDSLSRFPNVDIVGEFETGNISIQEIHTLSPDVIFVDIEMPQVNGIELARKLSTYPEPPQIVFVTAYDTYAVQAFELCAIDYLLKPFDNERISETMLRVTSTIEHRKHFDPLNQLTHISQHKYLEKIVVKTPGSIRIIDIDEVRWFGSSGNYVEVHHSEGKLLHRVTLAFLEQHIDPDIFIRTHRTAIVRRKIIKQIKTIDDNKHVVVLPNNEHVQLSKTCREALLTSLA